MLFVAKTYAFVHVVEKDETIESIASIYNIPKVVLIKANPGCDNMIYIGQKLQIPMLDEQTKDESIPVKESQSNVQQGVFIECDNQDKVNKTIDDLPFLSKSKAHLPISYGAKDDKDFFKKYDNLFTQLEEANNESQKSKALNKLINLFNKYYDKDDNSTPYVVSSYQLGHYFAFGMFDNYYDGKPTNLNRTQCNILDKELALKYLDGCPKGQALLRLIPNTWLYDYSKAFTLLCTDIITYSDEFVSYLNAHREININLFDICYDTSDFCDTDIKCIVESQSPDAILILLSLAYRLEDGHPIKQQLLPELSGEQVSAIAYQNAESGNAFSAMFYGALASLKGDANGLIIFINTAIDNQHKHYASIKDSKHQSCVNTGLDYLITTLRLWLWKEILHDNDFTQYDEIIDAVSKYCDETHEQLYAEYKTEQDRRKKERRNQMWNNIGMALLSTAVQVGNQYLSYQQNVPTSTRMGNTSNAFNLNQLLDPRLAAVQVNNQYIAEYNSFCFYNKKPDGSSYSFDEWMALRAQAYSQTNNANESTYDSNVINENTSTTNSTSSSSSCPLCHGKGRIAKDMFPAQYGYANNEKEKCPECGEWFPKSWGHTHVTCPVCHGH